MAAKWYLVAGPTGAGKTTVSRQIAAREGGVVFSIDEWMQNLYWMDCPEKNDLAFALDRIARCEAQIAAVAEQLASAGISCVLDLGFTQRAHRAEWQRRASAAAISAEVQAVDVPAEDRWQRVLERNRAAQDPSASQTYSFIVTREMFDFMEARWEPVSAEEGVAFSYSNYSNEGKFAPRD
jgi:predicted kinase